MGYLDHIWEIDPGAVGTPDDDLVMMVDQLSEAGSEAILYVLKGYEGLRRRYPQSSQADCFHTSMIWWFG